MRKSCIVNLGLYRSGTTTLARSVEMLGFQAFREFPTLDSATLKGLLLDPELYVKKWWTEQKEAFYSLVTKYDLVCDGWIALLVFLSQNDMNDLREEAVRRGLDLVFVCTIRDVDETTRSELHHWVRHDLERRCELSPSEKSNLATLLRTRAHNHQQRILRSHNAIQCTTLQLQENHEWPKKLSSVASFANEADWKAALDSAGKANSNPPLPVEGILLTLRLGSREEAKSRRNDVDQLLSSLEKDDLCNYLLVLGLDSDEIDSPAAQQMVATIDSHVNRQSQRCIVVRNDSEGGGAFPICRSWDRMAVAAWESGADWVVLLGDDIDVKTDTHYRSTYRTFLDISERLGTPPFFGCPWWNDETFVGFPTFPVVGRIHYEIFGGLIPSNRKGVFVNQDLDPYLRRLYLGYGAAPPITDVIIRNQQGGTDTAPARYERISAEGWRDFVIGDASAIEEFLQHKSRSVHKKLVVDVATPSYRVDVQFLERICQLAVPESWRTTFIIIVDNPAQLQGLYAGSSLAEAERLLETRLVQASKGRNNVRVRANSCNSGASASRNRAILESSAQYVLFLDDDVIPSEDVLESYSKALSNRLEHEEEEEVLGLIGMVRFPRSPGMPLLHASVLMSYLTFMFEIASNPLYQNPAWGVTANILVKRRSVLLFDTDYAKTGGGEDVDFCLRLGSLFPQGRFHTTSDALVYHPFWKGGFLELSHHFFNWAIGDSALFARFPEHCFRSWPNASELIVLVIIHVGMFAAWNWSAGDKEEDKLVPTYMELTATAMVGILLCDVVVDASDRRAFEHRKKLLGPGNRSVVFLLGAHVVANLFVVVLEFGRIWGHLKRGRVGNVGLRFDWHVGRLVRHRRNFRNLEFHKFVMFTFILAWCLARVATV